MVSRSQMRCILKRKDQAQTQMCSLPITILNKQLLQYQPIYKAGTTKAQPLLESSPGINL
jgi:hypothetical protein